MNSSPGKDFCCCGPSPTTHVRNPTLWAQSPVLLLLKNEAQQDVHPMSALIKNDEDVRKFTKY